MSTGVNPQRSAGAESSGDPRRAAARAARALVGAMAKPGGETMAWLKGSATEWVSELVSVRVELAEVDPLRSVAIPAEREEESRATIAKRGIRATPLPDGVSPVARKMPASPSLERERAESMTGTPAVDRLARERAQGGRGLAVSKFGPSGPVRLARASRGGDAAVPPTELAEQDSRAVEPAPSQSPADREATSGRSGSPAMIASQLAKDGGRITDASRAPTGGAMALLARLVDAAEAARGSANAVDASRTTETRETTPAKVARQGTSQGDGREPSRGVIGPALSALGRMAMRVPASDQDASGIGSRVSAGSTSVAGAAALPPLDASDMADLIAEALDEEARRSGVDVGVQG